MKSFKKILSILLLFLLLISGCTVNRTTGLIIIFNLSDKQINNIKIGEDIIKYSIKPGEKYEHWFFNEIGGKITADEIDLVLARFLMEYFDSESDIDVGYAIYKDNPVCRFKLDYQYHIEIMENSGEFRLYVNHGISPADGNESTEFDYPAL